MNQHQNLNSASYLQNFIIQIVQKKHKLNGKKKLEDIMSKAFLINLTNENIKEFGMVKKNQLKAINNQEFINHQNPQLEEKKNNL